MPAFWFLLPCHLIAPKNQSLSFRIGPPSVTPASYTCSVVSVVVTPRERRSSLRLSLCSLSFVNSPERLNENLLPPSLGTPLAEKPLEALSAVMPPLSSTISSMV